MTDRPIIFSAPMVRALLDGRKTQTRRTSGLADVNKNPDAWSLHSVGPVGYMAKPSAKGKFGATFESRKIEAGTLHICPQISPYAPGDRLWVREAWKPGAWREDARVAVDYRASPELTNTPWIMLPESVEWDELWCRWTDEIAAAGSVPDDDGHHHWEPGKSPMRWRSPIHMPRWASRMTLTVTDVRVQRLQQISEADAVAEGPKWVAPTYGFSSCPASWGPTATGAFAHLWNSLHGPDAWGANPWVCAITFTVRQGNIDCA